ncbi:type II toxin-antitoxin system RelE/ParE family toxin [uncultured Campylobacter sp.]|jgi:addiction module toxin, relE/stbE family|uniref:type II toxin-antitoxin system RelE family toxin n=1 Tax=uncultured Campylobacter sp. TaxID=218934 RepID=UPI0026167A3D|nr:type II toxin-antitoxin system RelE/ParE family toxin [uncultured Campylobacter sp.]
MRAKFSENALKQLKKLDKSVSVKILKKLKEIETLENPRNEGRALMNNLTGFWRYRVGGYRIICKIKDNELIIPVVGVKNRSEVYDSSFSKE